jgi:hypothetical protein
MGWGKPVRSNAKTSLEPLDLQSEVLDQRLAASCGGRRQGEGISALTAFTQTHTLTERTVRDVNDIPRHAAVRREGILNRCHAGIRASVKFDATYVLFLFYNGPTPPSRHKVNV